MRKIVLLLMTLITSMGLLNAETLYVNLLSGETITFNTTEINQITFSSDTSIDDMADLISQIPIRFLKNYPNPFNPSTTISFQIDKEGKVLVEIFNIKGQKVKILSSEYRQPGNYNIIWDGKSTSGSVVSSGLYLYKVSVNGHQKTNKMLLVK